MKPTNTKYNRRQFLTSSGLLALGAVSLPASSLVQHDAHQAHNASLDSTSGDAKGCEKRFQGRIFFQNGHEFSVIEEAAERIFPEDELGAGAKGLGVGFFIDNQLAGNYGSNAKDYRAAPFIKGKESQGYQYALTRGELFKLGVKALDFESNKKYKKGFLDINGKQKDEILKILESNKSSFDFQGASAKEFFAELRAMTLAGVYADPIYGGNANMQGWRMKQYPGAQMSYQAQVNSGDKFEVIEPVSLSDMVH